ncbi:AraC family transcriptional regulator [Phyllobacterium bourgognense]|uniref:AraC family transcriptional regulator n=1 Tax=Phyllobacterium bourgognense TaxID=314236 RepID=A0A368YIT8_9HYPH|nr:AraC family transcriptional regulator [Phyllobacterium bourgognense]RCW80150.1 AraC family transcriptional regulator [Phyllobacterium bourgognense]
MTETYDFQPDEVRRSDHSTLVHQHINWGVVRAHIVKRTGLARQETRIAPDQHSFLINLKGGARSGEDFVEGRSVGFTPRRPGSVVFVPAHREWSGWDEGDATGSYLFVSVDTKFIEEVLGSKHLAGLKPAIGFRDNMIEDSLQRIAAELNNPDPISVTMAESQAVQLFVQLLRLNGVGLEPAKGGLSPLNLKRINAIIESRPANPPSLEELVREIGVSRRHFFRAFKQSTGKTPHSYVAEHRLKRAVDLLRTTDLSATDIALGCGFASSSHFTVAFKQALGTGPSEFRRRWRS